MNTNEEMLLFGYWQLLWREATPATQRRWRLALIGYLVAFVLGGYLSATQIPSIMGYDFGSRLLALIWVGPMSLIWLALDALGVVSQASQEAALGWMLPGLFHGGPVALLIYLGFQPVNETMLHKRAIRQHEQNQGRLEPEAAAEKLPVQGGVLLATVRNKEKKRVKVGVDFATGQGHVMVVAATRAGKGLHLTDVLTHWPGPAVVVDPKSEQLVRTSGFREKHLGPVFQLPGDTLPLSRYYDFLNNDDIQELHDQLLRPEEDAQRIFADKSLTFFKAIGHFARVHKLDPLRVLLDAAEDDFQKVLVGLDKVPEARPFVRQFTNGKAPEEISNLDRFVASAYGTFTTRLFGYQKHIDTIAPLTPTLSIPQNWTQSRSTLYITYSLSELVGVGGVVAAVLAGLMRYHMKYGQGQRLLIAIDEMAAVRLRHLDTYLATVGGYGITLLLYTQSKAQLSGIYGRDGVEAILSNCAHQLWYPPKDFATANYLSDLYGTKLKVNRSYSTVHRVERQPNGQTVRVPQQSVSDSLVEAPVLLPAEIMALGDENVLVFTGQDQQLRFIGQRLDSRSLYAQLPPPVWLPKTKTQPRIYTEWLPEAAKPIQPAEPAAGSLASAEPPKTEVQEGEGTHDASEETAPETEAVAKRAPFNEAEFGIEPIAEEEIVDEGKAGEPLDTSVKEQELETADSDATQPVSTEAVNIGSPEEAVDSPPDSCETPIAPPRKFDDQAFQ